MGEATLEPRLKVRYRTEIAPKLSKRFGYKNPMQMPRLSKVVVNMGLGEATANPKLIDAAVEEMSAIAGQKPVVTRAKKSIAAFKLRTGMPIGVMVTLLPQQFASTQFGFGPIRSPRSLAAPSTAARDLETS